MPAHLNERFYPILLSRLEEPLTREEIEGYFRSLCVLADEAIRKRERYVVVVLDDVAMVRASGRKLVSDAQAKYLTRERNDATLAAFVPIRNAFARGAVTALRWLAPEILRHVQAVASLEDAYREALSLLAQNGTPFTGDPDALRVAMGLESIMRPAQGR